MNKTIFIGRPTTDPEIIVGRNQKSVARFTLAVDRIFKRSDEESADFIPIVAFGKSAELTEKYITKGRKLCVTGSLRNNNYEKDGVKHYSFQVVAEQIELLDKKETTSEPSQDAGEIPAGEEFMDMPDDAQLPFE